MANKPDEAQELTDEELEALERRISAEYARAARELQEKIDDYFAKFEKRDAELKKKLDAGEITEEYYKQWRLAQIGRGERFEALRDRIAERMTRANEVAAAYINDATPGLYSLNRNYAAYTIEQVAGDVGFDLWDEETVRRLLMERPDLMPYYPPERAVNRGIDLKWGKQQITAQVTSGILQGESIKHLADRLQKNIPDMNRTSAIRAARTAVTGAQNAGRMDSYDAAGRMGIKLKKEWLATLDGRTRHSHAVLDGEQVENEEKFSNGCMFPGDPNGPPSEIYNCRCTLIAAVDGVNTSDARRRARDPETGQNVLIEDMTYSEWAGWKENERKTVDIPPKSATIKEKAADGGEAALTTIGKIDVKKYSVISDKIRSSTLVLTDNQKEHIIKRRGQEFYDKYGQFFREVAEQPDYIFKDKAHENTAIASKTITLDGKHLNLVIRLALENDEIGLENSIITAIVENDKRYKQRIRNNIALYKSE